MLRKMPQATQETNSYATKDATGNQQLCYKRCHRKPTVSYVYATKDPMLRKMPQETNSYATKDATGNQQSPMLRKMPQETNSYATKDATGNQRSPMLRKMPQETNGLLCYERCHRKDA